MTYLHIYNLQLKFTIARYFQTYVLGKNWKIKRKIKNATNKIENNKN